MDLVPDLAAQLIENNEFIVDLARFAEALTDEVAIREKYRLADADWTALGENDELVRKITDEKTRRIRTGASKREKAQLLVVKAPDVAASIMNSTEANDRHRLDACKVLNDFAANPQDNTPAALDRFVIRINLGADVDGKPIIERYDKSIAIDANNGGPDGGSAHGSLPIANKWDADDVAPVHTGYGLIDQQPDRPSAMRAKTPVKTGENEKMKVARAATVKPGKTVEHKTGKVVERKTPEELALESLMSFEG